MTNPYHPFKDKAERDAAFEEAQRRGEIQWGIYEEHPGRQTIHGPYATMGETAGRHTAPVDPAGRGSDAGLLALHLSMEQRYR